jgi:hypothetical protein
MMVVFCIDHKQFVWGVFDKNYEYSPVDMAFAHSAREKSEITDMLIKAGWREYEH